MSLGLNRIIQNNQPVFILLWLGFAALVIVLSVTSVWQSDGVNRVLAIASSDVYFPGVPLPAVTIDISLHNRLQSFNLESMTKAELHDIDEEWSLGIFGIQSERWWQPDGGGSRSIVGLTILALDSSPLSRYLKCRNPKTSAIGST